MFKITIQLSKKDRNVLQNICSAIGVVGLELNYINQTLRRAIRPARPGLVSHVQTGRVGNMLSYKLTLPALDPVGSADVVTRRLTVNGTTQEFNRDQTEVDGFSGEQGSTVEGTLTDIDDAGNESAPSAFSFVLTDTIPPSDPGAVGLIVTEEPAPS